MLGTRKEMHISEQQRAFVLRIVPSQIDRIHEALKKNQLIIGWAEAPGLLNKKLTWSEFRQIIKNTYHAKEPDFHKAGAEGGNM